VKTIVPQLQPMSFGQQPWCLGASRLYQLPARLSRAPRPLAREELNMRPHFFS
jgi:hypothetical protein